MTLRHRYPLFLPPIALTLALWSTILPLVGGQTTSTRTAILYFNSLYRISFPQDNWEQFLQCLCDNTKKACNYRYDLVTINNYDTASAPTSEDASDGDPSGETFLCHPGSFASIDSVSCVRSPDISTWCDDQSFCQPVSVTTAGYVTCDASCVSMGWIARSLSGLNFTGNLELVDGFCAAGAETTQASGTTAASSSIVSADRNENFNEFKTLEIITLCLVILILISVFLKCLYFKLFHNKGKSINTVNAEANDTQKSRSRKDENKQNVGKNGPASSSHELYEPLSSNNASQSNPEMLCYSSSEETKHSSRELQNNQNGLNPIRGSEDERRRHGLVPISN